MSDLLYMIDLFCGAGGVSEGAIQAGFLPIFSSDISDDVEKTYTNRHKQLGLIQGKNSYFLKEDIRNLNGNTIFSELNKLEYNETFKQGDIPLVFGGPSCFTKDTLVLTKQGYKKITDLTSKDYVLSHDKKYHKIEKLINQGKKYIYQVKSDMYYQLNTTLDHKFYVKKKNENPCWKTVKELQKSFSEYYIGSCIFLDESYTEEDWKYIGEECTHNITKNNYEIPLELFSFTIENTKYVLDNIFMKNDSITVESEVVALGLQQLILKAYNKGSSIFYYKCVNYDENKNIIGEWNYYKIKILDDCIVDNNYCWYPIKGIKNSKKKEVVYDITVNDSHSFLANNCIVHNCQGFTMARKRDKNDPRNILFKEYLRVISEIKPKYAIMENVVGFMSFISKWQYSSQYFKKGIFKDWLFYFKT